MNKYEIGDIIQQYLKKRRMTQVELATKMHVEKTVLNRWIKGKSVPDADIFLNIAYILDIKLDEITRPQSVISNEQRLINAYDSLVKDEDRERLVDIVLSISKMVNKF